MRSFFLQITLFMVMVESNTLALHGEGHMTFSIVFASLQCKMVYRMHSCLPVDEAYHTNQHAVEMSQPVDVCNCIHQIARACIPAVKVAMSKILKLTMVIIAAVAGS